MFSVSVPGIYSFIVYVYRGKSKPKTYVARRRMSCLSNSKSKNRFVISTMLNAVDECFVIIYNICLLHLRAIDGPTVLLQFCFSFIRI